MQPNEVPEELVRIATEGLMGLEVRRAIANVWPEIERLVRAQVASELRADADAHRRVVERKPSEHNEARLARARTLDDAAARVSGRRA